MGNDISTIDVLCRLNETCVETYEQELEELTNSTLIIIVFGVLFGLCYTGGMYTEYLYKRDKISFKTRQNVSGGFLFFIIVSLIVFGGVGIRNTTISNDFYRSKIDSICD